jgi:hypothetical protein
MILLARALADTEFLCGIFLLGGKCWKGRMYSSILESRVRRTSTQNGKSATDLQVAGLSLFKEE